MFDYFYFSLFFSMLFSSNAFTALSIAMAVQFYDIVWLGVLISVSERQGQKSLQSIQL